MNNMDLLKTMEAGLDANQKARAAGTFGAQQPLTFADEKPVETKAPPVNSGGAQSPLAWQAAQTDLSNEAVRNQLSPQQLMEIGLSHGGDRWENPSGRLDVK